MLPATHPRRIVPALATLAAGVIGVVSETPLLQAMGIVAIVVALIVLAVTVPALWVGGSEEEHHDTFGPTR